jgi:hypothetical protein
MAGLQDSLAQLPLLPLLLWSQQQCCAVRLQCSTHTCPVLKLAIKLLSALSVPAGASLGHPAAAGQYEAQHGSHLEDIRGHRGQGATCRSNTRSSSSSSSSTNSNTGTPHTLQEV